MNNESVPVFEGSDCVVATNGRETCYQRFMTVEYKDKEWTTAQNVQWFAGGLFFGLLVVAFIIWIGDLISKVYEAHTKAFSTDADIEALEDAVAVLQTKKGRKK